jgi:hypothetical protein
MAKQKQPGHPYPKVPKVDPVEPIYDKKLYSKDAAALLHFMTRIKELEARVKKMEASYQFLFDHILSGRKPNAE